MHNISIFLLSLYLICIVPMAIIFLGLNIAYYRSKFPGVTPFKREFMENIPISSIASLAWPFTLIQHYFLFDKFKYGMQFSCEHSNLQEIERYETSDIPIGNTIIGEKIYNANGKAYCKDCGKVVLTNYKCVRNY